MNGFDDIFIFYKKYNSSKFTQEEIKSLNVSVSIKHIIKTSQK